MHNREGVTVDRTFAVCGAVAIRKKKRSLFHEEGTNLTNKNERNVSRELPVQNVHARTGIQACGDTHRVRGDQQGNQGRVRGRTGIQETGDVPRVMCLIRSDVVLSQSPGSNLDGCAGQGNPGTILVRTGIQETGNVHSVIQCEGSTVR
ncbi:hypothetical protein LSAT2_008155 [Lamellibrachia satsuma]|nr:hypothetical protein LSAT2_008155 [Lamellibrachia satsuma]